MPSGTGGAAPGVCRGGGTGSGPEEEYDGVGPGFRPRCATVRKTRLSTGLKDEMPLGPQVYRTGSTILEGAHSGQAVAL